MVMNRLAEEMNRILVRGNRFSRKRGIGSTHKWVRSFRFDDVNENTAFGSGETRRASRENVEANSDSDSNTATNCRDEIKTNLVWTSSTAIDRKFGGIFCVWRVMVLLCGVCQHLAAESHETRVSAVRLSFDKELRRYLKGIIKVLPNADVPEFIKAVKMLIRGQKNSLLDQNDFYNRQQDKGESFDSVWCGIEITVQCEQFLGLESVSAVFSGGMRTMQNKVTEGEGRHGERQ